MTRARPAHPLRIAVDPCSPLCPSGKRAFRTEDLARAALREARWIRVTDRNGGRRPGRVECGCYRCVACRWWHLTSASGPRRRRREFRG